MSQKQSGNQQKNKTKTKLTHCIIGLSSLIKSAVWQETIDRVERLLNNTNFKLFCPVIYFLHASCNTNMCYLSNKQHKFTLWFCTSQIFEFQFKVLYKLKRVNTHFTVSIFTDHYIFLNKKNNKNATGATFSHTYTLVK